MPIVSVEWLEGRSQQQKRELVKAITQAFVEIAQVSKEQVWIVFQDVKGSDWAMGGKLVESKSKHA
jgi:4-oxalocrotonate tautomerase